MQSNGYRKEIDDFLPVLNGESSSIEKFIQSMAEYRRLMSYYTCAMMEVETKFNVLNEEFSLRNDRNPISSIKTRIKTARSVIAKLKRKNLPLSIESIEKNLNDVAGLRVVCSFTEDVTTLANALLSQDDVTLIQKKDYITNPKSNGYRSLHLIVGIPIFLADNKRIINVEIQLRTISMDCWASLEHQLKYKKANVFTADMIKELSECAELSTELDKKMDELRKKATI